VKLIRLVEDILVPVKEIFATIKSPIDDANSSNTILPFLF